MVHPAFVPSLIGIAPFAALLPHEILAAITPAPCSWAQAPHRQRVELHRAIDCRVARGQDAECRRLSPLQRRDPHPVFIAVTRVFFW
jgi:hypothetical protein